MSRLKRAAKKVGRRIPGARPVYAKLRPRLIRPKPGEISYQTWLEQCEPGLFADTIEKLAKASYRPLISVVVPCYNTPTRYLDPLIDSVRQQSYENWELVLVNGSPDQARRNYIEQAAQVDERIKHIPLKDNKGIVATTNAGLAKAKGEFIAFMDHDDILAEHALAEVVIALNANPKADLIYSEEDKLTDNGTERRAHFFKPDWSPEYLLSVNYITHLVVARKKLVDKIGGLRTGFDGAQDYDFLLRFTEQTDNIVHIPKILYHWRLAKGSTAIVVTKKDYATTAGQRALQDALKRRAVKAKVLEIPDRPTNYRVQYEVPAKQPKVSIIIPFKDKADLLKQCVGSIFAKSTYKNYELILVSNNSTEPALFEYLEELKKDARCKVFIWDHPFNYSAVNNYGRKQASGEYLILLNNDTEVITPNWIEELVGVASQPDVGEVGPLLLYPNKTIQHAGVILGMTGMAGHVFRHHLPTDWTDFGLPNWSRNYLAVTAACVAISAKKFDQVGGLDEKFIVAGNDVAIGLRLYEAGYRNVYWPYAELYHHENVTVGSYDNVPISDYNHSLTYYKPYLNWGDPYFNLNLDLMNEQVGLRSDYGKTQ